MNEMPVMTKLSIDRYDIYAISHDCLCPLPPNNVCDVPIKSVMNVFVNKK